MANLDSEEKAHLDCFTDSSFEEYLMETSRSGTYADHIAIQYTSRALNQSIKVVKGARDADLSFIVSDSHPILYIGYIHSMIGFKSPQKLSCFVWCNLPVLLCL